MSSILDFLLPFSGTPPINNAQQVSVFIRDIVFHRCACTLVFKYQEDLAQHHKECSAAREAFNVQKSEMEVSRVNQITTVKVSLHYVLSCSIVCVLLSFCENTSSQIFERQGGGPQVNCSFFVCACYRMLVIQSWLLEYPPLMPRHLKLHLTYLGYASS